jgi:hypothetical protein
MKKVGREKRRGRKDERKKGRQMKALRKEDEETN